MKRALAVVAAALAAAALSAQTARAAHELRHKPRVPGGIGMGVFLDPSSHLFGDTVNARLEVVFDREWIDERSVLARASFPPYRFAAPPAASRSESRGVVTLRYRWRLLCLRTVCRPRPGEARTFRFPPATVTFRRLITHHRIEGGIREIGLRWYPLTVASRLSADTALRADLQVRAHPLPPVDYRVSPKRLSSFLFSGSALVALAGLVLVGRGIVPRARRRLLARRLGRFGPVERELALLRDAIDRDDAEAKRKALDALALALGRNGTEELARAARRLAWSPHPPDSAAAIALADDIDRRLDEVGA